MKFHPLSEAFPLMSDNELAELIQDIRVNGLLGPVTLLDGKILDGRNRYLACKEAGLEIKTRNLPNKEDPVAFVVSANLRRRHLTESQRAMIGAKLLKRSTSASKGSMEPRTTEKVAKTLNVGRESVKRAKKILAEGTERDVIDVESGKKKVRPIAERLERKLRQRNGPVVDKTGYAVPAKALPCWNRCQEANEILRAISHVRSLVRAISPDDLMYAEVNIQGIMMRISQLYTEFSPAVPYAVCTTCQGIAPETCAFCKGRGVISKYRYDTCVPQELKAMRAKDT